MTVRVASKYFMPLTARRPLYGGVFDIPAVPKGGDPVYLTINDHIQLEQRPHVLGGGRTPVQIRAIDIANCIVKEWSLNGIGMSEQCGPAVWVVRDFMPMLNDDGTPVLDVEKRAQFRPATEEEKAAMWEEDLAAQTLRLDRWCDWLSSQGDILDADPEQKQRVWITKTMREGAKYQGRTGGWIDKRTTAASGTIICKFCEKPTSATAPVCQHCDRVLDKEKFDRLNAKPQLPPPVKQPVKDQQPVA